MVEASAAIAQLYRRAGFGATSAEQSAGVAAGYTATVRTIVNRPGRPRRGGRRRCRAVPHPAAPRRGPGPRRPGRPPGAPAPTAPRVLPTRRLVAGPDGGHHQPVAREADLRAARALPRRHLQGPLPVVHVPAERVVPDPGGDDFTALTQAVATDPAMLLWLDAATDKAASPNENFARELMERFTMGIGTYSEADVRAAAVCFTGWRLSTRSPPETTTPHRRPSSASPASTPASRSWSWPRPRTPRPGSSPPPSGAASPTR